MVKEHTWITMPSVFEEQNLGNLETLDEDDILGHTERGNLQEEVDKKDGMARNRRMRNKRML